MIMTFLNILLIPLGIGRHIGSISPPSISQISKITFSGQMIYQLVLALTRLAMCIFYVKIFQDKWSRRLVYGLIALTSIGFLAVEFATLFRCQPTHLAWKLGDVGTKGTCHNPVPIYYASILYNIVSDFLLLGFVIPRFLCLHISLLQKSILVGIASVGLIVITASILRFLKILAFDKTTDMSCKFSLTLFILSLIGCLGLFAEVIAWSSIEVAAGIVCACAPTIRPLLRKLSLRFGLDTRSLETGSIPSWIKTVLKSRNAKRSSNGQLEPRSGTSDGELMGPPKNTIMAPAENGSRTGVVETGEKIPTDQPQ